MLKVSINYKLRYALSWIILVGSSVEVMKGAKSLLIAHEICKALKQHVSHLMLETSRKRRIAESLYKPENRDAVLEEYAKMTHRDPTQTVAYVIMMHRKLYIPAKKHS